MLDLLAFPAHSRIWIYSSAERLDDKLIGQVYEDISRFVQNWQSHKNELAATGGILHNHFVVLVVDETKNPPGGCSIDQSVHFIRSLGDKYGTDFLQRTVFHYLKDEQVFPLAMNDLDEAYKTEVVSDETLFFDQLVSTKEQFIQHWLKPLSSSWHSRFLRK